MAILNVTYASSPSSDALIPTLEFNNETAGVYNLHIADTFAMQAGDTLAMKIAAFGSTKTMSIPASSVQTWLSGVIVG